MTNPTVVLRAYGDGLHLIIRSQLSITEVEAAIQREISRMNRSLAGASVQIDLKAPTLKAEEIDQLTARLQDTHDLTVRGIEIADEPVLPPIAAAPTTHVISQPTDTGTFRDGEAGADCTAHNSVWTNRGISAREPYYLRGCQFR